MADANDLFVKRITKQMLKSESGEFSIESIHTIRLRSRGITELGCIGECTALERLDLSSNRITSVKLLTSLVNLVHLDLSSNQIVSLEGLQTLENLQTLNLAGNLINSLETLRAGLTGFARLTDVRFNDETLCLSNPVCSNPLYRAAVVSIVPTLSRLDGSSISSDGASLFDQYTVLDSLLQECDKAHNTSVNDRPAGVTVAYPLQFQIGSASSNDLIIAAEKRFADACEQFKKTLEEADKFVSNSS